MRTKGLPKDYSKRIYRYSKEEEEDREQEVIGIRENSLFYYCCTSKGDNELGYSVEDKVAEKVG